jgi:predicted nucleotidyltransferase
MITQKQFKDFLHDIEPSPTTKSNASAAHTALREFLRGHSVFSEVHIDTFLSGSYKRDTAIRPVTKEGEEERPDVDIIVVTNHTLYDEPRDVLDLLYRTLREKYDDIRKQTRSVGISTASADIDVVPIIAPQGLEGTLYIPDRKLAQWLVTNPPRHTVWTTEVNKASGGRFKPLVKLMKWWRRENPTIGKKPKGFVIECITAECMDPEETQYADLFLGTMEGIGSQYAIDVLLRRVPCIDDPGVPGNSVTDGMSFDAFEGFYNKAKAHAELGRHAQSEQDPDEALALWRKIFGPRFPAANASKANSLLSEAAVPSGLRFPDRPVAPRKPGGFA